jgi:hypothetical protein
MTVATLILVTALAVTIGWIARQERRYQIVLRRLVKAEQRLHSAKLTLTDTKELNQQLAVEVVFLKQVMFDVAKGEADVWIEDGELRAARTATDDTPVH